MVKRLSSFITVITVVALLAPLSAMAAKATPSVTSVKIHRTPSGPSKGALTILATANFSGKAGAVGGRHDARSLAMIVVTVRGANRTITAHDTVRLTPRNTSGRPVPFDIRIPRSAARAIASDRAVTVTATVTRQLPTTPVASVRIGRAKPWAIDWQCMEAQANGFTGTCSQLLQILNTPPPAPAVGFQQWQNGTGPGYVNTAGVWVPGGDEALLCVVFGGNGYALPEWQSITLTGSDNTTTVNLSGSPNVPASGVLGQSSYLSVWTFTITNNVATGENNAISAGPWLAGQIPTSVLSQPVGPATGNATLTALPQTAGLPTTWSLSPLSQSEASGVC
jgi:hypothetical protein